MADQNTNTNKEVPTEEIEVTEDREQDEDVTDQTPPLFLMKRSRTSWWNIIRLIAPSDDKTKEWNSSDAIGAWCIKCKTRIPFTKGNVNAVKRHIMDNHPKMDEAPSLHMSGDTNGVIAKRQKTMLIKDAFATAHKQEMQPSTKADQKLGEAILVHWTCTSLCPFSIIEDEGFLKFAQWLNKQKTSFKFPSRNKHKQQLMSLSKLVENNIINKIENDMEYFCLTTDIWSSRVMESYMAETLHYITPDFEMCNFTIEVTPFHGSHTSDRIHEFWTESFSKYGLKKEKLTMMLCDNASNGVKACKDWGIHSFGCIGHSLHLVVGPFLIEKHNKKQDDNEDDRNTEDDDDIAEYNKSAQEDEIDSNSNEYVAEIRKLVSRVCAIVKFIKNSPKAKDKISTFMEAVDEHVVIVTLDVWTRWNSAYNMIMKVLSLKESIQQFLMFLSTNAGKREFSTTRRFPLITENEWAILAGLCVLLEPFKEVTENLSGDKYPTFAHALPLLRGIKSFLEDEAIFDESLSDTGAKSMLHPYQHHPEIRQILDPLRACQQIVLKDFVTRFQGMDRSILWISYLDPRL